MKQVGRNAEVEPQAEVKPVIAAGQKKMEGLLR